MIDISSITLLVERNILRSISLSGLNLTTDSFLIISNYFNNLFYISITNCPTFSNQILSHFLKNNFNTLVYLGWFFIY